jgi:DnaJ like chaperone protein
MPVLVEAVDPGRWWGKAAGLMLGAIMAGWSGGWLGLLLGHVFDVRLRLEPFAWSSAAPPAPEQRFRAATLALMGYVASLGGPVSGQKWKVIERFLDECGLEGGDREHARHLFACGANSRLPVARMVRWLCSEQRGPAAAPYLARVAIADGPPERQALQALLGLARRLGVPEEQMRSLLRGGEERRCEAPLQAGALRRGLLEAFALLGIDDQATAAEIKRAYRRAVARYHPDRLLAAGASELDIEAATRATREIRAAYEDVLSARGLG